MPIGPPLVPRQHRRRRDATGGGGPRPHLHGADLVARRQVGPSPDPAGRDRGPQRVVEQLGQPVVGRRRRAPRRAAARARAPSPRHHASSASSVRAGACAPAGRARRPPRGPPRAPPSPARGGTTPRLGSMISAIAAPSAASSSRVDGTAPRTHRSAQVRGAGDERDEDARRGRGGRRAPPRGGPTARRRSRARPPSRWRTAVPPGRDRVLPPRARPSSGPASQRLLALRCSHRRRDPRRPSAGRSPSRAVGSGRCPPASRRRPSPPAPAWRRPASSRGRAAAGHPAGSSRRAQSSDEVAGRGHDPDGDVAERAGRGLAEVPRGALRGAVLTARVAVGVEHEDARGGRRRGPGSATSVAGERRSRRRRPRGAAGRRARRARPAPRGARRLTATALSRGRKPSRCGTSARISRGSLTRSCGGLHGASPPDRRAPGDAASADLCTRGPRHAGLWSPRGACAARLPCPDAPSRAPPQRAPGPASPPPSSRCRRASPRRARRASPAQASPTGERRRAGHPGARRRPRRCCPRPTPTRLRRRRARRPGSPPTLLPVPDGAEVLRVVGRAGRRHRPHRGQPQPAHGARTTAGLLAAVRAPLRRGRLRRDRTRPRPSPASPRRRRSRATTAPSCSSSASSTVTASAPSRSAGGSAPRRRRLPA